MGKHVVCAKMTQQFLTFSKERGNDLITPRLPTFPGLKEGDQWCLCIDRFIEALEHGVAPAVDLEATSQQVLMYCSLSQLVDSALNDH